MEGKKTILITGANGYIGSKLIDYCLSESQANILLWLHASSEAEFLQKKEQLEARIQLSSERIKWYWGDLQAEEPFACINPMVVNMVVHTAAVTRFNVEHALAQKVNVEGSERLFEFCTQCSHLERIMFLSTVYSSGLRSGAIEEEAFKGEDGFANFYESSKWAAEMLLLKEYSHLPWQIVRVATIISDDESGRVSQYNAFHNTLKLLYYGLLPLIPGKRETPLYFVTGQFVTQAIFNLLVKAPLHTVYHVAHTRDESLSLGHLMDLTFSTFNRETGFNKRRVIPPLYSDQQSFLRLADSVQGFGGTVIKQAVASVTPFSKQLFLDKDVKNRRLVSSLGAYSAPNPRQLVENICTYLVQTRWGREGAESVSVPVGMAQ